MDYYLIDGTPDDSTAMLVMQRLQSMGKSVFLWESMSFPSRLKVAYNPEHPEKGAFRLDDTGQWLPFEGLRGVYRRGSKWIAPPQDQPFMNAELIYWNIESALGSLYRLLPCKWVNPLETTKAHKHKSFQLKQMSDLGIRIPKTMVTNSVEHVRELYDHCEGNVILKYPQGGTNTEHLSLAQLNSSEFHTMLKAVPVKVQECIDGLDIRVYVLNDQIFALEIHSDELDFRKTPLAYRQAVELPEHIQQQCFRLREAQGLIFTGIDMKLTPAGEYVFFEANPTPVFLYDEIATGYPLSRLIAEYLVQD